MALDFVSFAASKLGWTKPMQMSLRSDSQTRGVTPFHYLNENGLESQFHIDFNDLTDVTRDYCHAQGFDFVVIEETGGFEYDSYFYEHSGGLSESMSRVMIPIVNAEGIRFAVTQRIDDIDFLRTIKAGYNENNYTLAIADSNIWAALHRIFMEPQLFAWKAIKMEGDVGAQKIVYARDNDSEQKMLFRSLIIAGHERRASDIHIVPCRNHAKVQMRIDGEYRFYVNIPLGSSEKIYNIVENIASIPSHKPEEPVDGQFRFDFGDSVGGYHYRDLRLSSLPVTVSEAKSNIIRDYNLRYLNDKIYTLEEIGMSSENREKYMSLIHRPGGLIIVTGPTGSGKSTLITSAIKVRRDDNDNVITIEDPVEKHIDGVTQVDIRKGSSLTYSDALKATLRHDPDMLVVGEIRDNEVAMDATRAANTGVLIMSTLHANDALGVIERLVNLGVSHYSLGEVLVAVVSQRLVRRLCPKCKKPYKLNLKDKRARLFHFPEKDEERTFYKAVGCSACENIGYYGRIAVNEVLEIDPNMRSLIQKRGVRSHFENHLRNVGYKTLFIDGLQKASEGITSLEELEDIASDTVSFKL